MSKRSSKSSSGTKKKVVQKTADKQSTSSGASGSGIKSFAPLLGGIAILFITLATFKSSAHAGRYNLKNTLFLYLSIYLVVALPIIYFIRSHKKAMLLFTWSAMMVVVLIAEAYLRISNHNNILNYSELNEGYFTTNIIQYQNSLNERNKWNQLYLNIQTNGEYILNKPEYVYRYSLDSLGLNNCKSCYSNNNGPAILTLGDSFTWGMGAAEGKSWPQQLEGILVSKGFGDIRVCNGGVQGSDPVYMLDALKSVYESRFSPDLIILAINPSDIMDIVVRGGMDRYKVNRPAIEHQKWLPFYASSLVFRSYMRTVKKIDPELLIPEELKAPMMYDAYTRLFETIMAIRQYQAIKGKKMVLVYTPIMLDIYNGYSSLRDILSEARMQGIYVVDATEAFLRNGVNANNLDQYFWPMDSHNTEKGYALIAKAISDYLIANQLITQK